MLDKILDELKKDLEEAKEANSLTKANIEKIVKESTSKIVSEFFLSIIYFVANKSHYQKFLNPMCASYHKRIINVKRFW